MVVVMMMLMICYQSFRIDLKWFSFIVNRL
jgi:hypothetical protein